MLNNSLVTANIPTSDLGRAKQFYSETLGLQLTREHPGGVVFTTSGGTVFSLYQTAYAGQAGHTLAQFHVPDVAATVAGLEAKGLTFEQYEIPGATWDGAVAHIPEMGHAAWFKDTEDNILCIDDEGLA